MKRIKSILTTIIGLVLIAACFYFIYNNKATWAEASGFITIGIACIFSDDEAFGANFLPFVFKKKNNEPQV